MGCLVTLHSRPCPCSLQTASHCGAKALFYPWTQERLPCWVEPLDSDLVLTHLMHFPVFFFEANSPGQSCILGEVGKESSGRRGSMPMILGWALLSDMLMVISDIDPWVVHITFQRPG